MNKNTLCNLAGTLTIEINSTLLSSYLLTSYKLTSAYVRAVPECVSVVSRERAANKLPHDPKPSILNSRHELEEHTYIHDDQDEPNAHNIDAEYSPISWHVKLF